MMRRAGALLVAAAVLAIGLLRRPWRRRRIVPAEEPERGAELVVAALLVLASGCALMFVIIYALDWAHLTRWLGLALGGSLALIAAAMVIASRRLVPEEEVEESYDYPDPGDPEAQEEVARVITEGTGKISRRKLLGGAGALAGAGLGAAVVVPAASLGPALDTESLYETPWRPGRRLVDDEGKPLIADEVEPDTFYTAYPEGAEKELIASPVVVVRLDPAALRLPADRRGWAPEGILAYSKVCTHAGCAVAIYRAPLYPEASPAPALVCPCHYSTFDPAAGGTVEFGPAGRDLPQLPLAINARRELTAGGNFSGPVGPSYWGVRTREPG